MVQPPRDFRLETPIDSYTLLDADLGYIPRAGKANHVLFLRASNVLDEKARIHTSFLQRRDFFDESKEHLEGSIVTFDRNPFLNLLYWRGYCPRQ